MMMMMMMLMMIAGYCSSESSLKAVCSQIRVESPLYTLVRG